MAHWGCLQGGQCAAQCLASSLAMGPALGVGRVPWPAGAVGGKSRRLGFPGTPPKATQMARVCALPVPDAQCIGCEMGGMAASAYRSTYGACRAHAS